METIKLMVCLHFSFAEKRLTLHAKLTRLNSVYKTRATRRQAADVIEMNFHCINGTLLIVYRTKANVLLIKTNYSSDATSCESKIDNSNIILNSRHFQSVELFHLTFNVVYTLIFAEWRRVVYSC